MKNREKEACEFLEMRLNAGLFAVLGALVDKARLEYPLISATNFGKTIIDSLSEAFTNRDGTPNYQLLDTMREHSVELEVDHKFRGKS